MAQAVATSLYETLGGKPAVEAVVGEFYKRVLADTDLSGYFANTDMDKQERHQINFISMALGGPNNYSGRSMKKAHEPLNITSEHFDKVAGHLVGALKWAKVPDAEIDEVISIVAPLKGDVVAA